MARLATLLTPLLPLLASGLLSGCGDDVFGPGTTTVTGRVTDIDGLPVRGARVSALGRTAITTTNGAYFLDGLPAGEVVLRAEYDQDGVRYTGQNIAVTPADQRSSGINIVISPENRQARLRGVVYDRGGFPLRGASVFAYGGGLSSTRAVTDGLGRYELRGLVPDIEYIVSAGGRTYQSDEVFVTLRPREVRNLDFTLDEGGFPAFDPPEQLEAIAWTSAALPGRDRRLAEAYEAVKREFDPRRPPRAPSRQGFGLGAVEVELEWVPNDSLNLLGYGIYRGLDPDRPLVSIDLFRDPIASVYVDADPRLQPGVTYYYEVTALSVRYPDDPRGESPPSDRVAATPLRPLALAGVGLSPLEFRWIDDTGATEYVVFVFDRYPGIGVTSLWNNSSAPVRGSSLVYTGPALVRGRPYYYLVLGLANERTSRTLSEIGEFVLP